LIVVSRHIVGAFKGAGRAEKLKGESGSSTKSADPGSAENVRREEKKPIIKSLSKSVGDGAEWRLCGGYKIVYQ
jgi:hypothetical protein